MRPTPVCCDRCGKPVGAGVAFSWIEREMGVASFAWVDCGCGRGSVESAIRRRAASISPQWERAVRAAIERNREPRKRGAAVRVSAKYLALQATCPCPDCRADTKKRQDATACERLPAEAREATP